MYSNGRFFLGLEDKFKEWSWKVGVCHFSRAIIAILMVVKQMPSDFEMETLQVPWLGQA